MIVLLIIADGKAAEKSKYNGDTAGVDKCRYLSLSLTFSTGV